MAAYDDVAQNAFKRNVFAWPCASTDTFQHWAISTAVPSPQNRGFIRNQGSDLCLDFDRSKGVSAGVTYDLTNVVATTCADSSAMWIVDCNKDCLYGEWGSWSSCSQMCGGGTQNRTRQPILSARTECDDTLQQQPCNGWPCEKAESCMVRPTSDRYHLKCLGLSESDYSLVARPCTGEARQLWSYNGMYLKSEILINKQEVCLTVQKDLGLRAWPCNNGTDNSQKFDRYFDQIAAVGPALCVTVEGFLNYDVTTQNTILDVCIGGDNQNFAFDCVASDVCVNFCPGTCACHLDASLQPYCDCPGATCNDVPCINGGERYFDGTQCRCRCPPGYFGDQCEKPQQCAYSEWSSWTICTQLCGGGKTTRARTALIYPEICLDVTDIGDCNVQPCVPVGGAALLPATDTVFGVTPFSGCRMMPIDSPTMCLTNGAGFALGLSACSGSSAVAQSWSYDGKANINVQGRCMDISGGISGTNLISWDCHGGQNQMFTFGNRLLQSTDGRCVGHGPDGQVYLSNCQSSGGWTTDCSAWPSTSTGAFEVVGPEVSAATTVPLPATTPVQGAAPVSGVVPAPISGAAPVAPGPSTTPVVVPPAPSSQSGVSPSQGAAPSTPAPNAAPISGPTKASEGCAFQMPTTGHCLTVEGTNVAVRPCTGSIQEKWYLDPATSSVRSSFNGKCLDIEGGVGGYNLVAWDCHGQDNQHFAPSQDAITTGTGRCIDVEGGAEGTNAIVWKCNDGANQVWRWNCSVAGAQCDYGAWSAWTACTKSCGEGRHFRTRYVAAELADKCPNSVEVDNCNAQDCPVTDCQFTPWTDWTPCSATCDGGHQQRFRTISTTPAGKTCSPTVEITVCNPNPCVAQSSVVQQDPTPALPTKPVPQQQAPTQQAAAQQATAQPFSPPRPNIPQVVPQATSGDQVDCALGPWGSWAQCSASCGLGRRNRQRLVTTPPQGSGAACGLTEQWQYCNPQAC
eukprot:GGOE01062305.1.p1 GENE.GGOE01062305.1~~GGOE01062305.1.p1  ORF type:complete len:1119 (-),score=158.01 GGOE01062305.1:319-3219(-)